MSSKQNNFFVSGKTWPCCRLSLTLVAGASLVACGGGGGGGGEVQPPPPVVKMVAVPVRVIDGPIQAALVCADANANGVCDDGEVSAKTDADGVATLSLPEADVGKFGMVAQIGLDAVDKDNGAITTAYVMRAPAVSSAVISPLSTMVVAQQALTGSNAKAADVDLQASLQMGVSLLADYTKNDDASTLDASRLAADTARLWVVVKQKYLENTAGIKTADGKALAAPELDAQINQQLLVLLPDLQTASSVMAMQNLGPEAKAAAQQGKAVEMAGTKEDSNRTVLNWVQVAQLPPGAEEAASAPAPGLSLRDFSFTDPGNYYFRSFQATAQQRTPDAKGNRYFTEFNESRWTNADQTGGRSQFGVGYDGRGDKSWKSYSTYWTGTEWFACPAEFIHQATPWDKDGKSDSLYCKSKQSSSQRRSKDLSGLTMADVVTSIRAYSAGGQTVDFSTWGPDPKVYAEALSAKFPANAKLFYQTVRDVSSPYVYGSQTQRIYAQELAQGQRGQCDVWATQGNPGVRTAARSLDAVVAGNPGKPCVYGSAQANGPRDEAWGASTIRLAGVSDSRLTVPSGGYVDGYRDLRVSFGGDRKTQYWSCLRRSNDATPRNCDSIGNGSYVLEVLGDARVMRFTGLPVQLARAPTEMLLVERGDAVYTASKAKPRTEHQIRLNREATEALFTVLKMPS